MVIILNSIEKKIIGSIQRHSSYLNNGHLENKNEGIMFILKHITGLKENEINDVLEKLRLRNLVILQKNLMVSGKLEITYLSLIDKIKNFNCF